MRRTRNNSIRQPSQAISLPTNVRKITQKTFHDYKRHRDPLEDSLDDFQIPRTTKRTCTIKKANPFAVKENTTKTKNTFGKAFQLDASDDDFRPTKGSSTEDTSLNNTFKLPQRKAKYDTSTEMESFVLASKENESNKDKALCPYCSEILFPLTDNLEKAIRDIEEKDKQYERKQVASFKKMESASSFSTPANVVNKRPVSIEAKDAFCRLHKLELVLKPQAVKRGYPTSIDFDALEARIHLFDEELKAIIQNKLKSEFRNIVEDAYKTLGSNKARSTTMLMNRFEMCLPGYYGPQGSSVILSALTKLYMDTGYLKKELKSPQLPLEFLQQVLVPEVGLRLIRVDLYKKKNRPVPDLNGKAKAVMEESREYGAAMFPVENQNIETDNPDHETLLVPSDDSDSDSDGVVIIEQHVLGSDDDDDSD